VLIVHDELDGIPADPASPTPPAILFWGDMEALSAGRLMEWTTALQVVSVACWLERDSAANYVGDVRRSFNFFCVDYHGVDGAFETMS
jgi:hypothetical protein